MQAATAGAAGHADEEQESESHLLSSGLSRMPVSQRHDAAEGH
jgi:hypothetical protein